MRIPVAGMAAAGLVSAAIAEGVESPAIPEEFRDAPAIVLEDTRTWRVVPPRNADLSVRERVLVLDPRRFTDADRVIFYDREDSKLAHFDARTRLPDGSEIEVPDELRHDVLALGGEGLELRSFQFTFPAVQPGAILELE